MLVTKRAENKKKLGLYPNIDAWLSNSILGYCNGLNLKGRYVFDFNAMRYYLHWGIFIFALHIFHNSHTIKLLSCMYYNDEIKANSDEKSFISSNPAPANLFPVNGLWRICLPHFMSSQHLIFFSEWRKVIPKWLHYLVKYMKLSCEWVNKIVQ